MIVANKQQEDALLEKLETEQNFRDILYNVMSIEDPNWVSELHFLEISTRVAEKLMKLFHNDELYDKLFHTSTLYHKKDLEFFNVDAEFCGYKMRINDNEYGIHIVIRDDIDDDTKASILENMI